jgi:dihydrolipoamide dehydrogenase
VKYDVVVIGSGIGGYPAASYLAQKELKVAVVEEHLVGGECTNYGCVPSKAFYQVAEAVRALEKIGGLTSYKWDKLVEWVKGIVKESREGIEYLLESRGVTIYRGRGLLLAPGKLKVRSGDEEVEIEASKILLANGTDPVDIPVAKFDKTGIISNREALYLDEKPNRVLIIGGGVIGVELANAFSSLGIESIIVELLDHILPFTDKDIALAVKTHLNQRGVKVYEKTTVKKTVKNNGKYIAELSNDEKLEVDKIIVAVGRKPKTRDMGLENLSIELDQKGYIKVNSKLETSAPGVYAAGDVVGGPLLAHKALVESLAAARNIAGEKSFQVDYKAVPLTIFTGLEVASIGYTEKELTSMGVKYVKYRIPLYFLSAVKIKGGKNAFAKILLSENSEKILGIHIVAPNASEVISSYLPLYLGKLELSEASRIPYPHLTVSESLRDFAEYIIGSPVHLIKK